MYLSYFGLAEPPFNMTADPHFLFMSRRHREVLSHLLYGIHERKGFLEITGEVGTGKTTLCKSLLAQLSPNVKTALLLNANLPEMQLLQAILEDFGITVESRTKYAMLKRFNQFLLEQLACNCNVLLIIDEAQNLRPRGLEQIRLLSNLETDKEKLFQIVLVGQPELRERLREPSLAQLHQRIGVRYHMTPLDGDEVADYILHRLKVAGSRGDILFTEGALRGILEYSQGVPRLINIVCDKALLFAFVQETRTVDEAILQRSVNEVEGLIAA